MGFKGRFAEQQLIRPKCRNGSGATDLLYPRHVRYGTDSDRIAALRQWPVSELVNSARAPDEDPTLIDRISL
jgi:hypothetical protein